MPALTHQYWNHGAALDGSMNSLLWAALTRLHSCPVQERQTQPHGVLEKGLSYLHVWVQWALAGCLVSVFASLLQLFL